MIIPYTVGTKKIGLSLLASVLLSCHGSHCAQAADRNVTSAPYAAKADMKILSDAAVTQGSKTLQSASATFVPADAGKSVVVGGAGVSGEVLTTKIKTVLGRRQVTLQTAAATSMTAARTAYGTDNTTAFQAALDAQFKAHGGKVEVPSGAYLLLGTLNIPRFVRLHGDLMLPACLSGLPGSQGPEISPLAGGTTLGMVEGFGHADAPPFITVNTNSMLEGVAIYNPLQTNAEEATAPTPAPWAISIVGLASRVSNIDIVNMYQGIKAWGSVRVWIDHITGQPTFKGISFDNSSDVDRVESVQFVPQFNNNTTLLGPGKPGIWQWQMQHGTAFEIGRNDQFRLIDTFCLGYFIGYHFAVNPSGTDPGNRSYGRLIGCGADLTAQPVYVDDVAIPGITFTDCDFVALNDSKTHYNVYTAPSFTGRLSFVNCNFWNAYGSAVMINAAPYGAPNVSSPEVTFTSCQFQTWGISAADPCIQANGGDVRVMGCDFRLDNRPDLSSTAKTRQFWAGRPTPPRRPATTWPGAFSTSTPGATPRSPRASPRGSRPTASPGATTPRRAARWTTRRACAKRPRARRACSRPTTDHASPRWPSTDGTPTSMKAAPRAASRNCWAGSTARCRPLKSASANTGGTRSWRS